MFEALGRLALGEAPRAGTVEDTTGTTAGLAVALGVSAFITFINVVGTAGGVSTADAAIRGIGATTGSAPSVSTVDGVGTNAIKAMVGSASGTCSAVGTTDNSTKPTVASADGTSTADAVARDATEPTTGTADGTSTADAEGMDGMVVTTGSTDGTSEALGVLRDDNAVIVPDAETQWFGGFVRRNINRMR